MSKNTMSYPSVSLNDLRRIIPVAGPVITPYIMGEPGTAKSSLLSMLTKDLGDEYEPIYFDCGSLNYGDVGSYIPVHDTKTLEFYVSSLLKFDSPKKKLIMLDEFGKLSKVLRPTMTRLILERMVGNLSLTEGSIIFATSNSTTDGVGDFLAAHEGNRVSVFKLRKPRAVDEAGRPVEYLVYASENGVSPVTQAFAAMTPAAFASYEDDPENPMVFNPRTNNTTFLSLRSLTKADFAYIQNRAVLGEAATFAGLCGTVGRAAAEAIMAFIALEAEVTSIPDIVANPDTARMPSNMGVLYMIIFNAVNALVTQDDLTAFMKYMKRSGSDEIQAVFFTMLAANNKTARLARGNASIKEWMQTNYELV